MNTLPTDLQNIILDNKKDMDKYADLYAEKDRLLARTKGKWSTVSRFYQLSEDFMREFSEDLHWHFISENQRSLSVEFLRDFEDKIEWRTFTSYNRYKVEIIEAFKHKMRWVWIFNNTNNTDGEVMMYVRGDDRW